MLNESILVHNRITNRKLDLEVPYSNTSKYLGMTLDTKLKWKGYVKKQEELNIAYRIMYWLFRTNSRLTVENNFLYEQVLRSVWIYGSRLRDCTKKTNLEKIQASLSEQSTQKCSECPMVYKE